MSKIVVLDSGHGGVIGGVYQTAGKRSPKWHRGTLYEGMFNRWVVNRLIEKLDRSNIPYYHVSPELKDVSLQTRVDRANRIYDFNTKVWLLSIHANAGGGEGLEAFTTKGVTKSDELATLVLKNLENDLEGHKMRYDFSDGDRDKESNFYILRKTKLPAVLLETGFMDNLKDYNNLWDEVYLEKIVNSLFCTIKEIYEG